MQVMTVLAVRSKSMPMSCGLRLPSCDIEKRSVKDTSHRAPKPKTRRSKLRFSSSWSDADHLANVIFAGMHMPIDKDMEFRRSGKFFTHCVTLIWSGSMQA
jgi:hypothetical protein